MTRGRLRVYLGAAPGVGQDLRDARRGPPARRARHRRRRRVRRDPRPARTRPSSLEGLEVVPRRDDRAPRRDVHARWTSTRCSPAARRSRSSTSWRTPTCPGSRHEKRWQDVEELLAAGIDVITTVNIQHLESLNDVVEKITGVPPARDGAGRRRPRRRPDRAGRHVARGAAPPDGARQRLRAGEGRRRARQLLPRRQPRPRCASSPCCGLADRVDDALQDYREQARHHRDLGGPGAGRGRAHRRPRGRDAGAPGARGSRPGPAAATCWPCTSPGPTACPAPARARSPAQRLLVESLGGTYHQVVGDDVPEALLDFARAENATQLVLGDSRRDRADAGCSARGSASARSRDSGDIDVHIVTHAQTGRGLALPAWSGQPQHPPEGAAGTCWPSCCRRCSPSVLVPFRGRRSTWSATCCSSCCSPSSSPWSAAWRPRSSPRSSGRSCSTTSSPRRCTP